MARFKDGSFRARRSISSGSATVRQNRSFAASSPSHRAWARPKACWRLRSTADRGVGPSVLICAVSKRSTMKPRAWRRASGNSKAQACGCGTRPCFAAPTDASMRSPPRLKRATFRSCTSGASSSAKKSAICSALLSLAVDPFGDAIVRVGAMPRYGLSLQDIHRVSRHLRDRSGSRRLPALHEASGAPGLSTGGRDGFERLAADLAGLRHESHRLGFPADLSARSHGYWPKQLARPTASPRGCAKVAVWQFLNFVREQVPVGVRPADPADAGPRPPARLARRGARPAPSPGRRAASWMRSG